VSGGATGSVGQDLAGFFWFVTMIGLAVLPVAIAIAVMRYRLYNIDRIIRRTLVYGALAALLAGAYAGSILMLSAALAPVTSGNSLAVAGSTLLVAALFAPIRSQLRRAVDRRFYRSRYDATNELGTLTNRLRGEVDLTGVRAAMVGSVARTLQPASVSIWLRGEVEGRSGSARAH
jgi:hypothetical protein